MKLLVHLMSCVALLSGTVSAFASRHAAFASRRCNDYCTGTPTGQLLLLLHMSTTTTTPLMDLPDTTTAKQELIETAEKLKDAYGIFLVDSTAKQELKNAVEALENMSEPPTYHSTWKQEMLGDWELVCTTAVSVEGIDTSKLPFFDAGPLKQIRDSIRKTTNKYLTVTQKICSEDGGATIDRIDHVLEYQPPAALRDVLDNLPEQLTSFNINPLQVSKSKLVLIHKATVDEAADRLKIQLSLKGIVLNVAGTSTFLDPSGKDVTSINLPLGEFLNSGSFETTFMDDDLRISRGKQGLVDQLRVFVRPGRVAKDATLRDFASSGVSLGKGVDADLDVDETIDPEFTSIESPSDVEDV